MICRPAVIAWPSFTGIRSFLRNKLLNHKAFIVKKYLSLIVVLFLCSFFATAQSPNAFKYQAVLRNAAGQVRADESVNLVIALRQGTVDGTTVYSETHAVTANSFGLVNLSVGEGTTTDDFSAVDWANGPYFISLSVDGMDMGASQLLSVPYAKYADRAGNGFSGDYNDLTNAPDLTDVVRVATPQAGNLITYDGNNWVAKDILYTAGNTGGSQPFSIVQPYLGIYYCIALQGVFPSRSAAEPFIAEIMLFAGNFAPRGWAFCDGQLLSIASNTALFSLIGTAFGGDGRTTFALPDLRGRMPVHPGTGPGLFPRVWGERGGSETHTINLLELPSHTHPIIKQ